MKQFQSKYKAPTGYKFAVRVLTSVFWTADRAVTCELPVELVPARDMYQKFYCEDRHQGRTLSWHASAASLDLEGKFADGKAYTISASMFQGVVLLAFNTAGPAGHTFAGLAE